MSKNNNRYELNARDINNAQLALGKNIKLENNSAPSTDSKSEKIEDLLAKLKNAIEEDAELKDEQRKLALSKLQILKEASLNPNNETTKLEAVGAKEILKRIISGLSPTSALLNIGKTVLPAIAKFLGIGS